MLEARPRLRFAMVEVMAGGPSPHSQRNGGGPVPLSPAELQPVGCSLHEAPVHAHVLLGTTSLRLASAFLPPTNTSF